MGSKYVFFDIYPTPFRSNVLSEIYFRKLLGRTDIEEALKALDSLIQRQIMMTTVQVFKETRVLKDGARPYRTVTHVTLNLVRSGAKMAPVAPASEINCS